jgi:hypothetical protein
MCPRGLLGVMPDEVPTGEPELLAVSERLERPELGRSIDHFREQLTTRLLWVFGGTIGGEVMLAGIAAFTGHDTSAIRDIMRDVIPAETGLLGLAIGYYFGEKAAK